jgi:hypothetical protein
MRRLAIVGLVVTPALYAQSGPLPVNSGSVDYITMVTSSVDHLVTSGSPLFLSTGSQLLSAIGVIMLIIYGLKWAAFSASRHHPEDAGITSPAAVGRVRVSIGFAQAAIHRTFRA